MKLIFLTTLLHLCFFTTWEKSYKIELKINQIRNQNGKIRIAIFTKSDGFPSDVKQSFKVLERKVEKETNKIELELPANQYAIAILHDENENAQMDLNWLGIPKEGFGISNNKIEIFCKPTFQDALILIDQAQKIEIDLYYYR